MVIYVSNGKSGDELHISWGSGLMFHSSARLDAHGTANIQCSSGDGKILVNGKEVYKGYISDGLTIKK